MNIDALPYFLNTAVMASVVGAWTARNAPRIRTPYSYFPPRLNLTFIFAVFARGRRARDAAAR